MSTTISDAHRVHKDKQAEERLIEALGSAPLLHDLESSVLRRLASVSQVIQVEAGSHVCQQGDPADKLFVLLAGQLAGSSALANGSTAVVEVIRPGQTLGLSNVLARTPRVLTVSAITSCDVLAIDAVGLLGMIAEEPTLFTALLRAEAEEFRVLVQQVRDLKLRTTAQRLGCYLLALSKERANTAALRLPFDKRLLAAKLGCRQENLSRAFATLRSVGVETHGSRVILHDIAKLRDYSEPDDAAEDASA